MFLITHPVIDMFDDIPPLDDPAHHQEPYPQNPTQVTPQLAPAANHGYFPYMMPGARARV